MTPHVRCLRPGLEGLPAVAHLIAPKRKQQPLAPSGKAKLEKSLGKIEREHFDGERPDFNSEGFDPAVVDLAVYEVERHTQELKVLGNRLAWIDILYNKVSERAQEVMYRNIGVSILYMCTQSISA